MKSDNRKRPSRGEGASRSPSRPPSVDRNRSNPRHRVLSDGQKGPPVHLTPGGRITSGPPGRLGSLPSFSRPANPRAGQASPALSRGLGSGPGRAMIHSPATRPPVPLHYTLAAHSATPGQRANATARRKSSIVRTGLPPGGARRTLAVSEPTNLTTEVGRCGSS